MKIRNLTDHVQEIKVRELRGDHREFSVYIQPNGITDLDRLFVIIDKEKVGKLIEVVGVTVPVEESVHVEKTPAPNEETADPVESEEDPTRFICKECGSEFASARGLSTHMNKAHPVNN